MLFLLLLLLLLLNLLVHTSAVFVPVLNQSFYSPAMAQVQQNVMWNGTFWDGSLIGPLELVIVSSTELCLGPITSVAQKALLVNHEAGSTSCQASVLCSHAIMSAAIAVLDVPARQTPVDSFAVFSNLVPVVDVSLCTIPFLVTTYEQPSPSSAQVETLGDLLLPIFEAGAENLTVFFEADPNIWVVWCREGYFQFWQWFTVAAAAIILIVLGVNLTFLLKDGLKSGKKVILACILLAMLSMFWVIVRTAVNPSNCYGAFVVGWSSELDGFFFTCPIPASISSVLLLGMLHLEVARSTVITKAKLKRLRIPVVVIIVFLFLLQISLSAVVQAGLDLNSGAVIAQSIVYLCFYLFFLVFYLIVFVLLVRRIVKSPSQTLRRVRRSAIVAIVVVIGCLCAFASAALALSNSVRSYGEFTTLELCSDLTSLLLAGAVAFFTWDRSERTNNNSKSRSGSRAPVLEAVEM
jgi:hypothetical protein